MPGVPCMFSPITDTMRSSRISSKRSMRWVCSSRASSRLRVANARSPSAVLNTRQMVCSEDAWEIMMMLMPSRASAAKMRAAKPGMPIMPPPSMFTSEIPSIEAIPVMGRAPSRLIVSAAAMSVPGAAGLRLFLMRMGMFFSTAGTIV